MDHAEKSRLGALRRLELYGNPGTQEGRSKGGKTTTSFFRENPSLARKAGFIIRKEIKYPKKNVELAELMGIILGDGGLSGNHQLTIAFNSKTDREYSEYLKRLLERLFTINSFVYCRKGNNGADLVISSSNLIDFLLKLGLVSGNKVKNQVDLPSWVNNKIEYQKACVRGLVDTDGSFYRHRYNSNGKEYTYLKLCFTNCSRPILDSVIKILKRLHFKAYLDGNHVSIYSRSEVKRYFEEIGTHNPKHLNKIRNFLYS